MDEMAKAEIASLRAELAAAQERISELYRAQKNTILSAKSTEYDIDTLRAELAEAKRELNDAEESRNDAETRLLAALAAIDRLQADRRAEYQNCDKLQQKGYQDAEEIARLRAPYRNADEEDWRRLDDCIGHGSHGQFWRVVFKEVRAALACRPQPARNRPLPETRCDCCDNGLDDDWEFCPFCGQQHPDAAGTLACRPQEDVFQSPHNDFPATSKTAQDLKSCRPQEDKS